MNKENLKEKIVEFKRYHDLSYKDFKLLIDECEADEIHWKSLNLYKIDCEMDVIFQGNYDETVAYIKTNKKSLYKDSKSYQMGITTPNNEEYVLTRYEEFEHLWG